MKKPKPKDPGKTFETRRAAFRAAKCDLGIPMNNHPKAVIKPGTKEEDYFELDHRNRRLYIFELIRSIFGLLKINRYYIREDKEAIYSDGGRQDEHFNAGKPEAKLKKHYYFKRK